MAEVYIDAATAGNPGPSGAGIYIKAGGEHYRYAVPLPEMSNHEAEFHACLEAIKRCEDLHVSILSIRSDSKILVDSIEKNYAKNRTFNMLLREIDEKSKQFDYVFVKWIPSSQNGEADSLARKALRR
ncbi:reverse transcriptase-like protein [Alkalicoccus luteus]|uniref:Reverse transcriptase-like protein n=1 Tax=Alkalicoccus luteus TaxID=1237094 RepID=A0A969PX47_9BACI|nr:reverse transcriptase-like protein [Alkalicoccus luteus]NJP37247.1 reverse transcriptase-like protein [Alkalicoccus luteus]